MSRWPNRGMRVAMLAALQNFLWLATPAVATEFPLSAHDQAVGTVSSYEVRPSDTLMDVARTLDVGFTQLMAVNLGINPWLPPAGTRITVPGFYLLPNAPHQGIVVDLAAQRLYYFPPGKSVVETYPIGIGMIGADTPVGPTKVTWKEPNPTWIPPASIRAEFPDLPAAIPPGPENPLGEYALHLGWPSYLIHGTNKPDAVGRDVSHGCIRLYPEDIDRLFHEVAVGTPVRVVDDEVKLAWIGDELFMEMYPTKDQADEVDVNATLTPAPPPADLRTRVAAAAGDQMERVDWSIVERVARERTGVPMKITASAEASLPAEAEPAAGGETVTPNGLDHPF
ncbi:MAG TPA: L,D-transpeptidase family protein [Stellaceae bacterium]|nr:L,D-transpeptidase family protein [Stellaceae bacterium]